MTDYKMQLKEQMMTAQKQRTNAIDIFLNPSAPDSERLEAIKKFGTFNNDEQVQKALEILRNNNEHNDIRAKALEGLINELDSNEQLMDEFIAILTNKSAPLKLRIAALSVLQASSFSSVIFSSKRPEYMNALRKLIEDDNILKEPAMEYLAMSNDSYIQNRLLEGLNDPNKEITKPEIAIQLLSYDLHAEHYPVLRRIAENPPNSDSKKEALRSLAADPQSKNLLWKTLQNTDESPEIRHVSAVALEAMNPGEIQSYAKEVILNDKENDDLKTAMLNTLTYSANTKSLNDADFEKKLDDIQQHSSSPKLKKMYSKFKSRVKQKQ